MAKGTSGRIVIDVDPAFKDAVYLALAGRGSTLKDWFIEQARTLCDQQRQPLLLKLQEAPPSYPAPKSGGGK
jgi:hypothetical protein